MTRLSDISSVHWQPALKSLDVVEAEADIDQAIRAQERASEAVAASMGQAVEASAQTAERARATRAAADQVHALGGQLHAEVGRFVL